MESPVFSWITRGRFDAEEDRTVAGLSHVFLKDGPNEQQEGVVNKQRTSETSSSLSYFNISQPSP